MNNWIALAEKASKLPLGHYAKVEAREAVDQEYSACRKQSGTLIKKHKIKIRYIDPQDAMDLCLSLCSFLGSNPLKCIVIKSKDVSPFAGAHYCRGEIHFPHEYIHISTLLHELTHHFCRDSHYTGHGNVFMELQELVYQAAMETSKDFLRMKED